MTKQAQLATRNCPVYDSFSSCFCGTHQLRRNPIQAHLQQTLAHIVHRQVDEHNLRHSLDKLDMHCHRSTDVSGRYLVEYCQMDWFVGLSSSFVALLILDTLQIQAKVFQRRHFSVFSIQSLLFGFHSLFHRVLAIDQFHRASASDSFSFQLAVNLTSQPFCVGASAFLSKSGSQLLS